MIRRRAVAVVAGLLAVACLAGGCSKFAGEWVEEGQFSRDGVFTPTDSNRRAALKFEPPFIVKYGGYVKDADVVDAQTVEFDTYFEMSNGTVAQFGSIIARVEGKDRLIAYIGAEPARRFVRLRNRSSIFPPAVMFGTQASALAAPVRPADGPLLASTSGVMADPEGAAAAYEDDVAGEVACR